MPACAVPSDRLSHPVVPLRIVANAWRYVIEKVDPVSSRAAPCCQDRGGLITTTVECFDSCLSRSQTNHGISANLPQSPNVPLCESFGVRAFVSPGRLG